MMTAATAAHSAPQHPPIEAISDPTLFPRRDNLIRHLVGVCGWSRQHVAAMFSLSDRQVRRITTPDLVRLNLVQPDSTSSLTPKEIEMMARDYASDPYMTAEDREAAFQYLEQGCPLVRF